MGMIAPIGITVPPDATDSEQDIDRATNFGAHILHQRRIPPKNPRNLRFFRTSQDISDWPDP
jgi:hypothetical protein